MWVTKYIEQQQKSLSYCRKPKMNDSQYIKSIDPIFSLSVISCLM